MRANDIQHHLDRWQLRPDGEVFHGHGAIVVPVRTSDGTQAVLKLGSPSEHEHLVLRRWDGDGAVRLLTADPHHRALLLERLHTESLDSVPDVDACQIVASLYKRLHTPAMPQLRTVTSQLEQWTSQFTELPRNAPIPHRLIEQAITLGRELTDQANDDVVVHGDLHYANVLAAGRDPWLAISPKPLNGDPHYEIAPMLWNRWDELTGNVRDGVRRRFYCLVDAAGFDEDRARAWTVIRVVAEANRELHTARTDPARLTKYVALAKALQD
jgi:streptomycin 6-kinase